MHAERTLRYQTPLALPLLDIPASAWIHFRPTAAAPQPGEVVFGRVSGTVTVGTVDRAVEGHLLFRDGSSGQVTPILRATDLRPFGVVVNVTTDFA